MIFVCLIYLATLVALVAPAHATQEAHHAAIVLQFSDGSVQKQCLSFTEDNISGLDLLLKTGLDVKMEAYGGMGGLICKIGPDGCDYPGEPCVCQSYGPGGVYWTYHHLKAGTWKTSAAGANSYKVHNGDVEGWAWSDGTPPALFTFEQVCGFAPSQTASASATPTTAALPPTATPPATFTPLALPHTHTQTKQPAPTSAPVEPTTITAQPSEEAAPTFTLIALPTDTPQPMVTATHSPTPTPLTLTTTPTSATPLRTPHSALRTPDARTVAVIAALGAALGFVLWRGLAAMRPKRGSGNVD